MSKPLPTRNTSLIPTAEETAAAFAGAIGACLVLGAWFFAAGYAVFFFGIVVWKAARS